MAREARGDLGPRDRLQRGSAALGIALDDDALDALEGYLAELVTWNERVNLVGEHDAATLVDRHLVDALAAAPILAALGYGLRVADLGAGAGLPGIPLAITLRPRDMALVEPRQKRASFLRAAARRLPGYALRVVQGRAEDLATLEPGAFDAVVSRAALPEHELLAAAAVLLRPAGLVVAYRGSDVPPVLAAHDFAPPETIGYRLPGARRSFQLIVRRRLVSRET